MGNQVAMISIYEACEKDVSLIRELADRTWPEVYKEIITEAQISYMLDLFYSESALLENITQKNHRFFIIETNKNPIGFASFEHNYLQGKVTRLHKLYVLPEAHGQGLGRQLLNAVIHEAELKASETISLNVNKFNPAIDFYKKLGFEIVGDEKLPIGQDFFMDDYIMEFKLVTP